MSSQDHRPVVDVSATPSHATLNTEPSVDGGTDTGLTGIIDVVLTKAPRSIIIDRARVVLCTVCFQIIRNLETMHD